MITGSHTVIYTVDAVADRAFLRDVLGLPSVDAGGGWLIFGLPPSEVAFHPAQKNNEHRWYLICDDIRAFVVQMRKLGRACTTPQDQGWGVVTELTLPGGGMVGVYEPRHTRPSSVRAVRARRVVRKSVRRTRRTVRKAAKKVVRKAKKVVRKAKKVVRKAKRGAKKK